METADAIWFHLITVLSLVCFKLAVLAVGYLIARCGYDLLVKGVTGQFTFKTQLRSAHADLASASPGIFFILLATVLMAIAVVKDKPFTTTVGERVLRSSTEPLTNEQPEGVKPILAPLEREGQPWDSTGN